MSEGKAVSIVAVDGGYIVEYNELVRVPIDTSFKTEKNEKIKVVQHRAGDRKIAVRSSVDDVMKFVAELLMFRMKASQDDASNMSLVSGENLYDTSGDKYVEVAEAKMVSPSLPSYASKA